MKDLLESGRPININSKCCKCNKLEVKLLKKRVLSRIELEYRFVYNGKNCIGDVVELEGDKIKCIYEIYKSHRTEDDRRPEPWYEISAMELIDKYSEDPIKINCARLIKCDSCKLDDLKYTDLERYVRIKLGQNYENPEYDDDKPKHLRFDFDAQGDNDGNKEIVEIFKKDYDEHEIVLLSCKGTIMGYIIRRSDYRKHDYWGEWYDNVRYPYIVKIYFNGYGTVEIIMMLLRLCKINLYNLYDAHKCNFSEYDNSIQYEECMDYLKNIVVIT
jgi:hypothetical protein